jgi:hypothetical protein
MSRLGKWILICAVVVLVVASSIIARHYAHRAEWTVMVYMSSNTSTDSTIEQEALCDYFDMARVPNSPEVNIVVQLARPGKVSGDLTCRFGKVSAPQWSGMGRFHVRYNQPPAAANALAPIAKHVNMAAKKTLQEFVEWTTDNFKAKQYMLIFFNHGDGVGIGGQGYDLNETNRKKSLDKAFSSTVAELNAHAFNDHPLEYSMRDDFAPANEQKMYITDIEDALKDALGGKSLDIIAFNSCLMGMVENAYAFRDVSKFMIASEEPMPQYGFTYYEWLKVLTDKPTLKPAELGWHIVDNFKAINRQQPPAFQSTTLSLVDLSTIGELAKSIDNFAKFFHRFSRGIADRAGRARDICREIDGLDPCAYSGGIGGVDLGYYMSNIEKLKNGSAPVTAVAANLADNRLSVYVSLLGATTGNYASEQSRRELGSTGLSIYFPRNLCEFNATQTDAGYSPDSKHPSDFVRDHLWRQFLVDLMNIRTQTAEGEDCAPVVRLQQLSLESSARFNTVAPASGQLSRRR